MDLGLSGRAAVVCRSVDLPHERVAPVEDFAAALDHTLAAPSPRMLEVDMAAIGPFAQAFTRPSAGAAGVPPECKT